MDPLELVVLKVLLEYLEEKERLETRAKKDLPDQLGSLVRQDYRGLKVVMEDLALLAQKVHKEIRVTQVHLVPLVLQEMMGNMETVVQ